jgi:hypothetical protein
MPLNSRFVALLVSSMLIVPTGVQAQAPSDLRDLVGGRAPGGEEALQQRGYVHINTQKGDDRAWSYWWQPSQRQCISVAVLEGRFDSITSTPAADCNQRDRRSGNGTAAAVVAGAALIGAIALAHKSHSHDSGSHYPDDASEEQFERGYRDGLHDQTYHNYDRNEAYARGYESGVEQRSHETSYRNDRRGSQAGYRPPNAVPNLQGMRGSSADSELRRRGYTNVATEKNGNSSYTIWYNRNTRQCLQMGLADGRVANLVDIRSHRSCR